MEGTESSYRRWRGAGRRDRKAGGGDGRVGRGDGELEERTEGPLEGMESLGRRQRASRGDERAGGGRLLVQSQAFSSLSLLNFQ